MASANRETISAESTSRNPTFIYDAFLSHDRGDENRKRVVQISEALKGMGICCLLGHAQMDAGDKLIDTAIARGIRESRKFVMFCTKNYSNVCKREVDFAFTQEKTLIPVLMGGGLPK